MKRNSVKSLVLVSVALSTLLVGCGSSSGVRDDQATKQGGGDESTPKQEIATKSIDGKAVDGYLQYATVCLDLDKDGYCQPKEPSTQTSKDGSFKLDISADVQKDPNFDQAMLLVYGGRDADTGTDFVGKLLAPADEDQISVTPITTLVAKAVESELKKSNGKKLTKQEIKEKIKAKKEQVAKILDIKPEDITKDPVEEAKVGKNKKILEKALQLQKVAEAISEKSDSGNNNDKVSEVYEKLAQALDGTDDNKAEQKGVDLLLEHIAKKDLSMRDKVIKAQRLTKNIEKAVQKLDDFSKVAVVIKEDVRKIQKDEDIVDINDDDLDKTPDQWQEEFIKSDLRDIGEEVTQDKIAKIRDAFKNQKDGIRPGFLFEKKDEKVEDDTLKEIFEKVKKVEKKKEIIKKRQEAEKSGKVVSFEDGTKLYAIHSDDRRFKYEEISLDKGKVKVDEFRFVPDQGEFVEDNKEHKDIVLKDGKWQERIEKKEFKYKRNSDGTLIIPEVNVAVKLLNKEDLSEKTIYIDELDADLKMPKGAIGYFMKFDDKSDSYHLEHAIDEENRYGSQQENSSTQSPATVEEYVAKMCENNRFFDADGKECSVSTKEGYIGGYKHNENGGLKANSLDKDPDNIYVEGKWFITTVDGKEILNLKYKGHDSEDGNEIMASYKGKLYRGWREKAQNHTERNFNKVAIDAIKAQFKEMFKDGKIRFDVDTRDQGREDGHQDARPSNGEQQGYQGQQGSHNGGYVPAKEDSNATQSPSNGYHNGQIPVYQGELEKMLLDDGMKLYSFDRDMDHGNVVMKYEQITFDSNNINLSRYAYNHEAKEFQNREKENREIILVDGTWQKDEAKEFSYVKNSDGTVFVPRYNTVVNPLGQEDVSGKSIYVDALGGNIEMPQGAKFYHLSFENKGDEYHLEERDDRYSSLDSYVTQMCNIGIFVTNDNGQCDINTKSGHTAIPKSDSDTNVTVTGKWFIENKGNIEILNVKYDADQNVDGNPIFADYDGVLYRGWKEKGHKNLEINYNEVAFEVIKEALVKDADKLQNDIDNGGQGSSTGEQNSTENNQTATPINDGNALLMAKLANKTFFTIESTYDGNKNDYFIKAIHFDGNGEFSETLDDGTVHKIILDDQNRRLADKDIHPDGAVGTGYSYYQGETEEFLNFQRLYFKTQQFAMNEVNRLKKEQEERLAKHSEAANELVGMFFYFKDNQYVKSIAFGEDLATIIMSDNSEHQGTWTLDSEGYLSVEGKELKLYLSLPEQSEDASISDLDGSKLNFSIYFSDEYSNPNNEDVYKDHGELIIESIGM